MNRRQVLLGGAALAGCSPVARAALPFPLRRGINLGNALEAPNEGDWGYSIEAGHFAAIAEAGFDGVRLPVRWDAHADTETPYAIDADFLTRVDTVVGWALTQRLKVQLDCHHYDDLVRNPRAEHGRYLALWRQIAVRFAHASDALIFEPLNEPSGDYWTGARLAALQAEALRVIRASNPSRLVVLGGPNWNSVDGLDDWTPPPDSYAAATFHYYEPRNFTHENAEWLRPHAPRFGRRWGDEADVAQVQEHVRHAAAWANDRNIALQLGEFGVNAALPIVQRALWTKAVRTTAESFGLGWCVWDFAGAFPIYDLRKQHFIPEMLDALFG